jgi:hypothetical protein
MGEPTPANSSAPNSSSLLPGPLPLVLGITGHRDLREEDLPILEARVREVFQDFAARYPSTPLLLLSPLAEGADRLAARVALGCGAQLASPLPLPVELYEKDFETADSRAEFDALLQRAEYSFLLPLVEGNTLESIEEYGEPRDKQYALVGAYITEHAPILLALWDGMDSQKLGGTSQIVQFQLEGAPPPYAPSHSLLDSPENGLVYHILTPRKSNPVTGGKAGALRVLHPAECGDEAAAQRTFGRIFAHIEAFNRDALALDEKLSAARAQSKNYLLPEPLETSLPGGERQLIARYTIADSLAIHFARNTYSALFLLFALVFVGALFFDSYVELLKEPPVFLIAYLVMLGLAWLGYRVIKPRGRKDEREEIPSVGTETTNIEAATHARDDERRYLDYRALAEGLRVQFFWRACGLNDSVAEHYLRKQRSELDWIRHATRAWSIAGNLYDDKTALDSKARWQLVLDHWINAQLDYFKSAAKRDRHRIEATETRVLWLLRCGVGLAALLIVLRHPLGDGLVWIYERLSGNASHQVEHVLREVPSWLAACAPLLAATLAGHGEKRAWSQQAKQYARMSVIFSRASEKLIACIEKNASHDAAQIARELGIEALVENGDWVILHRERPLEVPHTG